MQAGRIQDETGKVQNSRMEIILSSPRSASARDPAARGLLLTGPVARTSLGDMVAERLRAAILNSELSPGQLLREARISESLGVSRSPVHAAFLMLEHEGLVTLSRHRGATVVQLSAEDLDEVHSLRLVIEELAVRLAIQHRDEADLKALERSLAGLRPHLEHSVTEQMSAQLDVNFHDDIYRAAHHDRLYRSWSAIRMQVHWLLLLRTVASQGWHENMIASHIRIVELIKAGDEAGAVSAVGEHIRDLYNRICTTLIEQQPSQEVVSTARQRAGSYLFG
jgi:DNA-binding GntR family transcriptional regulator